MANENSNVVVDRAQSHWSDLWKKEDYWAIWLGFALLIAAICIFINGAPASYKETIDKSNAIMKVEAEKAPFKTIAYIQAQDAKRGRRRHQPAYRQGNQGIHRQPRQMDGQPREVHVYQPG